MLALNHAPLSRSYASIDLRHLHFYKSGHHRGCALHAMLALYFYCGHERGIEVPRWLSEMAMAIPADIFASPVVHTLQVPRHPVSCPAAIRAGTTGGKQRVEA